MAQNNLLAIRIVAMAVALATCGRAQLQSAAPSSEEGLASWYGPSFDGQRAASGEVFDSEQLTAAHRTLPFGTRVRVRRLDSEESIVVRINDRGPYIGSRIIDLSYAAARRLRATDSGLLRVALEVVEAPAAENPVTEDTAVESPRVAPEPRQSFAVQVGTFRNADNAQRTRAAIQGKLGATGTVAVERVGEYWCVLAGSVRSRTEAERLATEVRQSDASFRSAFVVRLGPQAK